MEDRALKESVAGSCLCGGVEFEVKGGFQNFFLCHCSRCRKDTGSAHAANLFSTTAELVWLSGRDLVRTYTVPRTRHVKGFCSVCGSAMPTLQMDGALLVVPAGSLDGRVHLRPDAHICTNDRAAWDCSLETIDEIGGMPE